MMVNPAWLRSTVFTDIPGILMFLAKNIVLGHLLHTNSYWHWTMGWDLLIALRYDYKFGAPSTHDGYLESALLSEKSYKVYFSPLPESILSCPIAMWFFLELKGWSPCRPPPLVRHATIRRKVTSFASSGVVSRCHWVVCGEVPVTILIWITED